ncbi:MAG TPA: GMC family oxidoreductase [Pyrinomonadaceae bacterium]|nr:GMC family oxidoreductase [Pyrinomonadaceae bacterium]
MANEYDVIVIGGGVAGALVAWKLAEAKRNVLILDAGEKRLDKTDRAAFVKLFAEAVNTKKSPSQPYVDTDNSKFAHSPDVQDFNPADAANKLYYRQLGPNMFKSQYQRLFGGSTWAWRGNTPRYIPSDFKLKKLFGVGVDWPITYDDLESWYCDAEDALGVAADHKEWDGIFGAYRSRKFPMSKIAQAYGDQQLKKRLDGVKIDGVKVRIFALPQARNSRKYDGRPACEGNSNCVPLCPIQAKYDATVHVKKALKLGATMVEQAVVTDLKLDASGNISEVVYKTWPDGQTTSARGKIIVLAAHGIEAPKVLLNSNGGSGIANSSDQVGRNLMDHPGGEGAAIMPFQVFPFRGPQSTSCIESFRDHKFRDQFCAFRLTIGNDGWGRTKHPYDTLKDLTDRKLFGEELQKELNHTVTRQLRVAYSTEQLPDPGSRVTLANETDDFGIRKPQIAYKVDDYTRKGMEYVQKIIKLMFTKIGANEDEWEFSDLKTGTYSGSGHIMGTCRMGSDPASSVVDAECRSHDHKNLFVAGSAVFPTSSCVNPTITVAALALRTAASIQKQLAP